MCAGVWSAVGLFLVKQRGGVSRSVTAPFLRPSSGLGPSAVPACSAGSGASRPSRFSRSPFSDLSRLPRPKPPPSHSNPSAPAVAARAGSASPRLFARRPLSALTACRWRGAAGGSRGRSSRGGPWQLPGDPHPPPPPLTRDETQASRRDPNGVGRFPVELAARLSVPERRGGLFISAESSGVQPRTDEGERSALRPLPTSRPFLVPGDCGLRRREMKHSSA